MARQIFKFHLSSGSKLHLVSVKTHVEFVYEKCREMSKIIKKSKPFIVCQIINKL